MRDLQISILLISLAFATGCPNYRPKVDFKNPSSFMVKLNSHIKVEQEKARCFSQNLDYSTPNETNPTGCSTTTNSKPDGKLLAQGIRNRLVEDALPYIDGMYMDFITDIQEGRDRENFVADLIELGATAGVGIIKGPQRSIQIIGIALTAFKGGRRSRDLNFYKDQATPILINKMDGNRATVRAAIMQRETKDIDSYPIGMAVSDIVDYYNAGTLIRAFTELQKDTAAQTKISEDTLKEAKRTLGVVGAPTEKEIEESKQNFALVRRITRVWAVARDLKKAADKTIATEKAKQPPDVPDQTVIDAQQKIIDDQTKIQQGVLDDFRGLFDVIIADPKLKPFLDQIPVASSDGDRNKQQELQASLKRIKDNDQASPPTIGDYDSIMLKLSDLISQSVEKDPSLAGRLKTKLLTSKTLKDQ
jgi:hypothetical protein